MANLYVGILSFDVTDESLQQVFSGKGFRWRQPAWFATGKAAALEDLALWSSEQVRTLRERSQS